jgi:hypothetical protein
MPLCGIGEIIMRLDIQVTVRIARGESICSLLASSLVQIGKYYITLETETCNCKNTAVVY